MTVDHELLRQFAEQRSEQAFAELVQRHVALVYHAAVRWLNGDVHRAHDVTQAVFSDLARKAPALLRHPSLASWLHTSTRFAAASMRRAENVRQKYEQEAAVMNALLHENASADWARLRPVIDDVLQELDERDRTAILLRFFEERAFAEVGASLNVSEDAARMRVERALERLRSLLSRRGVTSTSAALGLLLAEQAAAAVVPTGLAVAVSQAALAVPIATVGAGSALLSFMATAKVYLGIGTVVFLVTAGTAFYELSRWTRAREALAAAARDRDQQAGQLSAAENQIAAVKRELAGLRTLSANGAATTKPAATPPIVDPATARGNDFMRRHPEVKAALERYGNARTDFAFAGLYSALHLTQAQIEQFHHLRQLGLGDQDTDGLTMQLRYGDLLSPEERDARLGALLGENGYQQYIAYSQMLPIREMVNQVAGSLYYTPTPLTPDQATKLADLINQSRSPANASATKYDWDAVIAGSNGLLLPEQISVLEDLRAVDRFQLVLNTPPPAGLYSASPSTTDHHD